MVEEAATGILMTQKEQNLKDNVFFESRVILYFEVTPEFVL
jgi:hypothetical protein